MKKRLLACVLTLVMLLALLPTAALAAGGPVDLTGTATISSTQQAGTYYRVTGNTALTLNSAVIEPGDDANAPAIEVLSGKLTLTLVGESTVRGGRGYAGIYVAPGAELVITGSGKLNAFGGRGSIDSRGWSGVIDMVVNGENIRAYYGGGAGIGGNGMLMNARTDLPLNGNESNFGKIIIESGEVSAVGGRSSESNAGAGAGIGSGGASTKGSSIVKPADGIIDIRGGVVTVQGGDGQTNSLTGGGAGIGSGGSVGGFYTQESCTVVVYISKGEVTATGMADGAGIGGGANVDGGVIEISGGVVHAYGGYEIEDGKQDGGYGGAGIGGGDNGGVTSITISGGNVYAAATGAAAGIGGGNDGGSEEEGNYKKVGDITICGDAFVMARGGSYKDGKRDGGAGIGAGRSVSVDAGFNSISILDTATVIAESGPKAQAIGVGTYYEGDFANKVTFDGTANVWMFNYKSDLSACWGLNSDGTVSGDVTVNGAEPAWYFAETMPARNTATAVTGKNTKLTWEYDDNKVTVLNGSNEMASSAYNGELTGWATLVAETKTPETPVTPGKDENGLGQVIGSLLDKIKGRIFFVPEDFPFYDVDSNHWFYEPVKSAWEQELIDGVTARYYMPDNTLTVAQAIKLAAALHQKQSVGFVTLQNGGIHWYDNYVNYAVANSLIEAAYQSKSAETMNAAVTRAEFVHILSKLLNTGAINTVNSIPDVKSGDAYADEIFAFYRAGILTGSDRLGTFHPESSLKRSEAAAILVRLYDATQRQYITLG